MPQLINEKVFRKVFPGVQTSEDRYVRNNEQK